MGEREHRIKGIQVKGHSSARYKGAQVKGCKVT